MKEDLSDFSRRGQFEQLSLNMAVVEAGAERPFSVLHLSDTHLSSAYDDEPATKQELCLKRTRCFGGHQEEALRDSLDWASRHAELVVHTGDFIDWQSRANFDLVRKYFGDGEGMVGCLGNHEYSPDMWLGAIPEAPTEEYRDLSREILREAFPFDIELQSKVVHGVNFVALDDVYGTVTARQVERFMAERDKGLPIVLCAHVPLYTEAIWRMARRFWDGSRPKFNDAAPPDLVGAFAAQQTDPVTSDFIRYLRREPLLRAILTGHEHISVQDRFSETAMEYAISGNFLFAGEEILFI